MNIDFDQYIEGGARDLALGVYFLVVVLAVITLCGIGAWTAGHWIWELA